MAHPYGRVYKPSFWDLLEEWKAKRKMKNMSNDEKEALAAKALAAKALAAEEKAKQKKEEMMGIYQEFVAFCESKGLGPYEVGCLAIAWARIKDVENALTNPVFIFNRNEKGAHNG